MIGCISNVLSLEFITRSCGAHRAEGEAGKQEEEGGGENGRLTPTLSLSPWALPPDSGLLSLSVLCAPAASRDKGAGHLITCAQFSFIAAEGFIQSGEQTARREER
jgi:hypothetical protein